MAGGLVVHITNGTERHTELLTQESLRVGPGEDCHIRLGSELLTDSSIFLELTRQNGSFRVSEFDPELGITHNGRPLARGAVISDGDELRFGAYNVAMQFFPVGEVPAVVASRRASVAPFIEQAALEAAATARRDDAKVFLREFTRELMREINPATKIIFFLIAAALVGGVLYLGQAGYSEMRRGRELIDRQNQQLAQLQSELDRTNRQLADTSRKNDEIRDSMSLAPRIFAQYGNGVCIIAGSYMLFEPGTGRPLRYPATQAGEDGSVLQSDGALPVLTPEGNGPPYIADFVGTGFHVGGGYLVTNRHLLIEPWAADDSAQALGASVRGQFRITRIVAFFPGHKQAVPIRPRQSSPRDDVAVGHIDPKVMPANVVALPLDRGSEAVGVGRDIVMMGYPSGQDRLLATLSPDEVASLMQRFTSLESLLAHLAERNTINPRTTRGHITDLEGRSIVFSASNAVGGSGSPLFGVSGRVIGINYAAFTGLPDQNYAVPVRYLLPILERAGWQSPDADADDSPEPAGQPKDPKATASPSPPAR
ncbi:MAG TPA: trypsin-like peptidase domain-containing protein [Pyrinomonadaceae bacterium]|nr:trypsin-like peptidase domain-containing protein [Pyrinomonadaceae bacterium]